MLNFFSSILLYKYPESSDKTSNLMVFPFIKIKQSVKADSKKFIKKLVNKDVKIKGFIENKIQFFYFMILLLLMHKLLIKYINYKKKYFMVVFNR